MNLNPNVFRSSPLKDITNLALYTEPAKKNRHTKESRQRDEVLRSFVSMYGFNWESIAQSMPNRSTKQCQNRWTKYLDPKLVKGFWQKEEDDAIFRLVNAYGPKCWNVIAKQLNGRTGKQCRERWHNHLDPQVNKGPWTTAEETQILNLQKKMGNRWAVIAKSMPG
ncbi:hypothetical protein MXB_886, partial [Myxobolus squamalis]